MFSNLKIGVVVPCFNEETQISKVIETMPPFVDLIVVIDDKSTDNTVKAVTSLNNEKVKLLVHAKNQGVGGAIATGYKYCRDHQIDVAVVMAGDGQMNPDDFENIIAPVVAGKTDYAKANRLARAEYIQMIPKVRLFGNSVLTLLSKIVSGYWHIADSQTGYTAINKTALHAIDWDSMYKRYGQPNDLLVRLNIQNFRVQDVPSKPVYNVGEKSGIQVPKVTFTIAWLMFKLFFLRLKEKYIFRDFHPLVFFYGLSCILFLFSGGFFVRLLYLWIEMGYIPQTTFIALLFTFTTALQSSFFAMYMDSDYNRQ